VVEQSFASCELGRLLADQPLDRWSGDGYIALPARNELLHQVRFWHIDFIDDMRFNSAELV
jgi:hypothetical protein